jgi:hypothetical protein
MHDIQKKILKHWEQGKAASQIADELGITRNAIMGHLYRMRQAGVKMRQKSPNKDQPAPRPIGMKKFVRKAPAPIKPTIAEIQKQNDPTPTGKPVPLIQLKSNSCRFVVSGVMAKDFLFCNEPKWGGSSYCEKHHYICYIPKSSIREQRAKAHDAATKSSNPS